MVVDTGSILILAFRFNDINRHVIKNKETETADNQAVYWNAYQRRQFLM